jgi:prepilin-type N-terminal cleavage/methylation domain-containing protein
MCHFSDRLPSARVRIGFTLIELLIVVAIIGILAAIAVPNFLNARTRASIARVKGDFRSIMTAMQGYFIDNNTYPPDFVGPNQEDQSYKYLTTPVAYLSSTESCRDHFTSKGGRQEGDQRGIRNFYDYGHVPYIREAGVGFVVVSFGPDRILNMPWSTPTMDALAANDGRNSFFLYESSNGLMSSGDIIASALGIHNH